MSVTGWRNALGESNSLIKQHGFFFNYAYWSSASLIWKQSLVQTTLFYLLGLPGLRHTAMGVNLYISLQLSRGSKLMPTLSFYLPPKYYMMPMEDRMRISRGCRPGGGAWHATPGLPSDSGDSYNLTEEQLRLQQHICPQEALGDTIGPAVNAKTDQCQSAITVYLNPVSGSSSKNPKPALTLFL